MQRSLASHWPKKTLQSVSSESVQSRDSISYDGPISYDDGLQARGRDMEKVMDEEVASDQRQALKRGVGDGSAPRAKTARK